MSVLEELAGSAAAALDKAGRSVVRIGRNGGRGCGVVVADGIVVTNAHNLRGDEALVTFADGRQEIAALAAADLDGDVAALRVDTGDAPGVTWASDPAALGTVVFAVTRTAAGGQ